MTSSFIADHASRHFQEQPNQPLLAGLARQVTSGNLLPALTSGCKPIQHLAWRRLVDISDRIRESLILKCLATETEAPSLLSVVLKAIAHESVVISDALIDRIALLLTSGYREVRIAAARVIAVHKADAALPILQQHSDLDPEVLRTLCQADDPRLIVPLMTAFGFPARTPPPTIGFVVDPVWLGEHFSEHPQIVQWLILNCGYCDDDDASPEALNLLSGGFSYVTPRMTTKPRVLRIAHRWQRRIRSFVWRLLPDELDLEPSENKPFDVSDPLEMDLFIAAVRDSDRLAFAERKRMPPFSRKAAGHAAAPVCYHAASRYVRKLFVDQPLAWIDPWHFSSEEKGQFLIEHARVLLEPDDETRLAADRALRGRWMAWSQSANRSAAKRRSAERGTVPVRSIVIGGFQPPQADERLSAGANSIVELASACGLDHAAVADWLVDGQSRWSPFLTPIGIEVQIPRVDRDRFAAWKDALLYLGIPSPVRPEFGGMLEAAFRPAASFHAMVLGPLLLCRLGVIAEPQDMALHISLQGEFDDHIRSLAFPHFFIHPSQLRQNRPDGSMTRVMSKGFVHVHDDAEAILPAISTTKRTEFRVFRIMAESRSVPPESTNSVTPSGLCTKKVSGTLGAFGTLGALHADGSGYHGKVPDTFFVQSLPSLTGPNVRRIDGSDAVTLRRGYISDVIAHQILGSAAISRCQRCRNLFRDFAISVERTTHELPEEFQQLLASNYLESTGDPRDETLLAHVPIFRCWSRIRQTIRIEQSSSSLDLRFRQLRNHHVRTLVNHYTDDHRLSAPEIVSIDDEIELKLPVSI